MNTSTANIPSITKKISEISASAKDFLQEEKRLLNEFGNKTLEDVESLASDAMEAFPSFGGISSRAIEVARKNPLLAVGAVVAAGWIVSRFIGGAEEVKGAVKKTKKAARSLAH